MCMQGDVSAGGNLLFALEGLVTPVFFSPMSVHWQLLLFIDVEMVRRLIADALSPWIFEGVFVPLHNFGLHGFSSLLQ